ncbi:MAG TPA: hypothetical protein VG518_09685 [Solirubrobacterales bacterium]|nr:hypothetical protein [Solirubrobacterales bacterium]
MQATLAAAAVQPRPWAARVVEAIDSLLGFAAEEPEQAAAILTPYLRDCSDEEACRYRDLIAGISSLLREGRDEDRGGEALPASNEQALAGAIGYLIGERLRAGEGKRLGELGPQLVEFVLAPYLGPGEARRWAARSQGGRT